MHLNLKLAKERQIQIPSQLGERGREWEGEREKEIDRQNRNEKILTWNTIGEKLTYVIILYSQTSA